MSRDYEVGKYKPPEQGKFKPGNQAAKGRGPAKKRVPTMKQLIEEVLSDKYSVRRGDTIVKQTGEQLLKGRLARMVNGTARELEVFVSLMAKHEVRLGSSEEPESVTVTYHVAKDSNVGLPPDDLLEDQP